MLALPWDPDAIGGVSSVVLGLYDTLEKDGRTTPRILVASWGDKIPIERLGDQGVRLIQARVRGPTGKGSVVADLLRYAICLPGEFHRIRSMVRRYAIEVVNCHYIGSAEVTWVLAKYLRIYRGKVLLSLHGLDIRNLAKLRGIRRAIWRWTLLHADGVVACSDGLSEETRDDFELPKEQVTTIHNGVDAQRLAQIAAGVPSGDSSSHGPQLLNLGTFEHKKGHDILLKAFRSVVDRYPQAHLTIMGRRSDCAEATSRLVRELGLDGHTTIRVDVPHQVAMHALQQTDIFVLSSRNEAFSIALLEAGALGKPIVATEVCGVAELIKDGITGLRVPPEDVAALTKGILRLLDDRSRALDYGHRLRDLVQSEFTLEENCRRYLELSGYPSR